MQEVSLDKHSFCTVAFQSLFLLKNYKNTVQLLRTRVSALRRCLGKRITSEVLKRTQIRTTNYCFNQYPWFSYEKLLTYSHKSRWRSWGSSCCQHVLFFYDTRTLLIDLHVTGVIHIIFFGKGYKEKMAAGEIERGKRCGQRKQIIFAASKICFFPPHCQIVLFNWWKADGPSDIWWSNKAHMLNASMKQRC